MTDVKFDSILGHKAPQQQKPSLKNVLFRTVNDLADTLAMTFILGAAVDLHNGRLSSFSDLFDKPQYSDNKLAAPCVWAAFMISTVVFRKVRSAWEAAHSAREIETASKWNEIEAFFEKDSKKWVVMKDPGSEFDTDVFVLNEKEFTRLFNEVSKTDSTMKLIQFDDDDFRQTTTFYRHGVPYDKNGGPSITIENSGKIIHEIFTHEDGFLDRIEPEVREDENYPLSDSFRRHLTDNLSKNTVICEFGTETFHSFYIADLDSGALLAHVFGKPDNYHVLFIDDDGACVHKFGQTIRAWEKIAGDLDEMYLSMRPECK